MPDFTAALAKGLDVRRKVFHGDSATLFLLDYAREGHRGYDALIQVVSGWHHSKGKEIDEPIILQVAEMGAVTHEKLNKTTAVSINGKVWKLQEGGRQAPTYPNKKIWKFQIVPTGEEFSP